MLCYEVLSFVQLHRCPCPCTCTCTCTCTCPCTCPCPCPCIRFVTLYSAMLFYAMKCSTLFNFIINNAITFIVIFSFLHLIYLLILILLLLLILLLIFITAAAAIQSSILIVVRYCIFLKVVMLMQLMKHGMIY